MKFIRNQGKKKSTKVFNFWQGLDEYHEVVKVILGFMSLQDLSNCTVTNKKFQGMISTIIFNSSNYDQEPNEISICILPGIQLLIDDYDTEALYNENGINFFINLLLQNVCISKYFFKEYVINSDNNIVEEYLMRVTLLSDKTLVNRTFGDMIVNSMKSLKPFELTAIALQQSVFKSVKFTSPKGLTSSSVGNIGRMKSKSKLKNKHRFGRNHVNRFSVNINASGQRSRANSKTQDSNITETPYSQLVLDVLISLMNVAVDKYPLNMANFWSVLARICEMGEIYRYCMVKCGLIHKIIDCLLNDKISQSVTKSINIRNRKANKSSGNIINLSIIVGLLSMLIRTCHSPSTNSMAIAMSKLSDNVNINQQQQQHTQQLLQQQQQQGRSSGNKNNQLNTSKKNKNAKKASPRVVKGRGGKGDKNKNKNKNNKNNKGNKNSKNNKNNKTDGFPQINPQLAIATQLRLPNNCLAMEKHQGGKIVNKLVILSQNDSKKYESSLFWEYLFSPHIIYNEIKQNSNYCLHASDIMNHLSFNNQTYSQLFVKSIIYHIGECGRYSLELKRGGSRDVSPQPPLPGDIEDVYDGDIDNDFYDIDSLQGYLQILACIVLYDDHGTGNDSNDNNNNDNNNNNNNNDSSGTSSGKKNSKKNRKQDMQSWRFDHLFNNISRSAAQESKKQDAEKEQEKIIKSKKHQLEQSRQIFLDSNEIDALVDRRDNNNSRNNDNENDSKVNVSSHSRESSSEHNNERLEMNANSTGASVIEHDTDDTDDDTYSSTSLSDSNDEYDEIDILDIIDYYKSQGCHEFVFYCIQTIVECMHKNMKFLNFMIDIRDKRWGKSWDKFIRKFNFDYYGAHYQTSYKRFGKQLFSLYRQVLITKQIRLQQF